MSEYNPDKKETSESQQVNSIWTRTCEAQGCYLMPVTRKGICVCSYHAACDDSALYPAITRILQCESHKSVRRALDEISRRGDFWDRAETQRYFDAVHDGCARLHMDIVEYGMYADETPLAFVYRVRTALMKKTLDTARTMVYGDNAPTVRHAPEGLQQMIRNVAEKMRMK